MAAQRSRQPISKLIRNRSPRPVIGKQTQAILDALPAHVALLDASGTIIAVNAAWHRFIEAHGDASANHGVGASYLQICQNVCGADARAAEHAIGVIVAREQAEYCYEYAYGTPDRQRWFLFRAARLPAPGPIRVMISHEDITLRKEAEARARSLEMAHQLVRQQTAQAFDETKGRLQALFDHAQDAFLLVDDRGHYVDANPAACALTGYSHAELLQLSIRDISLEPSDQVLSQRWRFFLDVGKQSGEHWLRRKDGSKIIVDFRSVAAIVPGMHLAVMHDITASKQAEAKLRDHTQRLSLLHEIDQTILSGGSLEDIAQAVLRVIYRLTPFQRGSILLFDFDRGEFQLAAVCDQGVSHEVSARRFLIAESAELNTILPALRRGESYVYDLRELMASWPEAEALLAAGMRYQICTPLIAQGELFGSVQLVSSSRAFFDSVYMPIIHEILDTLAIGVRQARLFDQMQAERERRRELARQLVVAQERERRQLAGELHDKIGQNLAVLNMNLTITRNQLSQESARRVDGRLVEAIQLVDQTVEQIRNVMAELRPAILDDFGLVAALRWYARHFARHTDLSVLLEVEQAKIETALSPDIETALFRIAQEALTNVLKHAHATMATLTLTVSDQSIQLVIADDGAGFNSSATRRPTELWSLGLMIMQERAESVGGRLVIDSSPGQGSRIAVDVAR